MHCRVLIPPLAQGDEEIRGRRFPAVELVLARGRRSRIEFESREQWLLEAFAVERQVDWPSAPYALAGEGGAPGGDYWMHADPAHFRADRDRLLVGEGAPLGIDAGEALDIAATINAHFGEALRLECPRPAGWYARVASPPPGPTLPLRDAADLAVEAGAGSIEWHALMNEIQMLLHEHPVNEAREARGAPAINGVWLWGGGRMATAKTTRLRAVVAADPLLVGLARCAGVPASALPRDADEWLARAGDDGVHLAALEAASLATLDELWAAPLVAALRRGRIGMLTLHFEGRRGVFQAEATAADLRRVWRLRRNIAHYLTP